MKQNLFFKTFIHIASIFLFALLTACNSGTNSTSGGGGGSGNSNYLTEGSHVQKNGIMSAIMDGMSNPAYNNLCQSGLSYNITVNSSGKRCLSGRCTDNPVLVNQSTCFSSNQNPGEISGIPGTITSYSDVWSNCHYASKVLTATRTITINANNSGSPYTFICTGTLAIY